MADGAEAEGTGVADQELEGTDATAGPEPEPEVLAGAPVSWSHGQRVLHVTRDRLVEVARSLRDDGWLMCLDLTAVDYLTYVAPRLLPTGIEPGRFELVVTLVCHRRPERLRIRVQVPDDAPAVESLYSVFPGVEAMEREVFDLFGITFTGHPDLTRILMPEDWEGHPLRKDYAVGRIPVQFKGAPAAR